MATPSEFRKLVRSQRGVFTRDQARGAGLTDLAIQRRIESGEWQIVLPCVIRLTTTQASWLQRLTAAWLWTKGTGVVSHRSAAALRRLEGFSPEPIELTLGSGTRSPASWVRIYYSKVPENEVVNVEGLNVTSLRRTLVDLAGAAPRQRVESAVDQALRNGQIDIESLAAAMEDKGHSFRGRPVLSKLLADRGRWGPMGSELERKFLRLIRARKLPEPSRQAPIEAGGIVLHPDFTYTQARLCIEVDGFRHHSDLGHWNRDLQRRNLLARAGWTVLHVTNEQIAAGAKDVLDEIERRI